MRVLFGSDDEPDYGVQLRLLFEPRDLWIGVFWNRIEEHLLIYVSIVPCFPLCFSWTRRRP